MHFVDLEPGDPRLREDVFPVLVELRTELTADAFLDIYTEGHREGLRFTAAYDDQQRCVAVAGWRVMATTAAGRKLYVDDLVTAGTARSRGIGSAMLTELTERARRNGCSAIDLDSALHRSDAHRFYIRERMPIVSFHFAKPLS